MVVSPVGLGTKNHCAGEAQQQFSNQSIRDCRRYLGFHRNNVTKIENRRKADKNNIIYLYYTYSGG
jgi:hypothetical protein